MVLRGVHIDRDDLLRAIVKQVEDASSAGRYAEHTLARADVQRLQLAAGIFVARRVADATAEFLPGNRSGLTSGRIAFGMTLFRVRRVGGRLVGVFVLHAGASLAQICPMNSCRMASQIPPSCRISACGARADSD
jgi:hypothetical protein